MSGIIDMAVEYAKKGFFVFPVNNNKTPLFGTNGEKEATKDINKIREFWIKNPDAGLAIATGPSKLTVIDIDVKAGVDVDLFIESLENLGAIPETIQTETPSGGRHLIFKNYANDEIISKTNAIIKGVDIRSRTGYIVAPPTKNYCFYDEYTDLFDKGNLEHIPKWLHFYIKKKIGEPKQDTQDTSEKLLLLEKEEFSNIRSALTHIHDIDDRDTWLKIGMALKTTMSKQAYSLWCEWSQQSEKYNPRDQKKTWDSISDFGECTIGSLFHMAKQNGWHRQEATPQIIERNHVIIEGKKEVKEVKPKKKFPQKLLNCPGLIGDITKHILTQSIKPQPILSLAAAITACGTIMGRKVQTETGLRTNIYAMGVGEAGSGKEAPRQVIKRIFNDAGIYEKCSVEDIASDTAVISALEGSPSSVFLLDEIGHFFKTTQNAGKTPYLYKITSLLMRLYGAANGPFAGKVYADKTKNVTIQQPNVSIFGTTVPSTLYESMTMDQVADGFLSRLLVFETEDHDPERQRISLSETPGNILQQLNEWDEIKSNSAPLGNIDALQTPRPVTIQSTDEARKYFDNFEKDLKILREELRKEGKPATLYIRTSAQAEQLALIRACGVNYDRAIIGIEDAIWACELAKYLADNMYYIVENHVSDNQIESNTKRILNHIREKGQEGISKSVLTRKNHRIKRNERDEIIKTLMDSGQVQCVEKMNEETKRKTIYFEYIEV